MHGKITPHDLKITIEAVLRGTLTSDQWGLLKPLLEKLEGQCHFVKGKFRVDLSREDGDYKVDDRRQTWFRVYYELMDERA